MEKSLEDKPGMLTALRKFFETHILSRDQFESDVDEQRVKLATAALLVEIMRADYYVTADERTAVEKAIQSIFAIDELELSQLIELAELEVKSSSSLYQFTALVDKDFDYGKKVHIVELMWEVAYSDACKDKHEEYLVRKISDLIHVSHKDFIKTRHKVEEKLGLDK